MAGEREKEKIFGFGTAALDFRIRTAELGSDYRDKLLARKINVLGGGAVGNCLVQASRLGGKTVWLGKLGKDWIGEKIVDQFIEQGVDCSNVIQDPSLCSPFNVAVYAGKSGRRIGGFLLPNSLNRLNRAEAVQLASSVRSNSWVIVEVGEIPLRTTAAFCKAVKERRGKVAIDVDLDPIKQCRGNERFFREICASSDLLIPNRKAISSIYPDLDPAQSAERMGSEFKTRTVVTAGRDGAYYYRPDRDGGVCHQRPFDYEVVDTVGAGDAFHGGLVFGLSAGMSLGKSVELGARCGALNCGSFGARDGMATYEEISI